MTLDIRCNSFDGDIENLNALILSISDCGTRSILPPLHPAENLDNSTFLEIVRVFGLILYNGSYNNF